MKCNSLMGISVAVALLLTAWPTLAQGNGETNEARYFSFVATGAPTINANEFIVEVRDPAIAERFTSMIINRELQPNVAFTGTIAAKRAPYNEAWPFHVVSETLEVGGPGNIEVCDASPIEIEDHLYQLGGSFLPGAHWCPWSLHISREVLR